MSHHRSAVIPASTYRFQFHKGFTFERARALVGYLHELGITHVYASPFFRAAPSSVHGYDVCDHNELNPEIGTRAEFDAFAAELHARGMGLVVDFVPNHMGIAEPENKWWMDVLENGPSSQFASFFDIDWHPLKRELDTKVLLPILGDQYGRVLESGEFRVLFEAGAFSLKIYALRLPIAPRTTRVLLRLAAEKLGAAPAEFESIITALEHLPARTETAPEKMEERAREKQVTRDRLVRLCVETPVVGEAINAAIEELYHGGDTASFDRLDVLLSDQPYRLSSWKVAAEEINYRRFFDINSLAAIRVELPEVFDATHVLILDLVAAGAVDGIRIDHIDGLADPLEYLTQLQRRVAEVRGGDGDGKSIYLLVEKILGAGERLRAEWPIHGTTGYEFANHAIELLVDSAAEESVTASYDKFTGEHREFREIVYRSKRLTMQVSMASEVNVLAHLLNRLSESNRWYRDFTINALTTAIREVIACFPVYRTYLVPGTPAADADVKLILRAIAGARRRNPALERTVFEFLRDVLLPPENNAHPVDEELRRAFVSKFQQCTGPITAKGVEDTAFYVYGRLVALNEVGGEPSAFGASVEQFHRQNAVRAADFPHSMLATSTHDTKRSEDVRARIAALSEMPREWAAALRRWRAANRKLKQKIDDEFAPDANEEYLIYQTLLGSWPLEPMDEIGRASYIARVQEYMVKALHEAKVNSSWIEPNQAWDAGVKEFVARILKPGWRNRFLSLFEKMAERIAQLGAINSLAQTALKLTAPGVPDFYQGSELWDFSLVDPDNRRPVDYELRLRQLASLDENATPAELVENWRDGRIKLFLTRTLLRFRREHPALFASGSYEPLEATGAFAESCVAFERRAGDATLLVVVPRLSGRVGFPPLGARWGDTAIVPKTAAAGWTDALTGRSIGSLQSSLALAELLADFPVAVLAKVGADVRRL